VAKKFGDEATSVLIDAIDGDRDAIIMQSAHLIYHLVVLWISVGVSPEAVWKRMHHRERLIGVPRRARRSRN